MEKNKSNDRKFLGRHKPEVGFPVSSPLTDIPATYKNFLIALKTRIQQERLRAVLSSNAALITLYWDIGSAILEKQAGEGWGAKVIDRLSADLKKEFPDMKGFSPRNLKYMRAFAAAWPDKTIVQRIIAQIPWRSNLALLDKIQNSDQRLWYAQMTLQHGWSQPVLVHQIESRAFERKGKSINNFALALPPVQSDMANQIFKDPYLFDFIGTSDNRHERELEQALIDHIQQFLLELGQGFAFVGRQVHLELGDSDFYLDLLFYHLKLRCYVVIELKAVAFDPGHVSKLNMYLNVVDDILRHPDDKPTIGLLLVKEKNKLVAEYALRGYTNPIGVSEWETQITRALPEALKTSLPSIEEIEAELGGVDE
ncbi:MAG: DUF1016 family protein [Desulfobacterales bacterium]|nr:DUF1016 family protein [Desulfobacterales bacterium]